MFDTLFITYITINIVKNSLDKFDSVANEVIQENGFDYCAQSQVGTSFFETREYDTFTLPAGEYKSLIIRLGEAKGKNWWCVVFPQLCVGTQEQFVETANAAGLDPELAQTLEGEYELRFWVLEKLGELKNHFFDPST